MKSLNTLLLAFAIVGLAAAQDDLIASKDLSKFIPAKLWKFVANVSVEKNSKALTISGTGGILVNGEKKCRASYLTTKKQYKDVRLQLEFMLPKNSNAGAYFMGRYEIQIFDSFGKKKINYSDLGGLYQRWDNKRRPKGYEGVPAKVNAAKAPGEWQTFDITFRAPRFNADGKKIENAKFIKVLVNGKIAHENQEAKGPTRSCRFRDEKPTGPMVIQGDHGPIAIRKFIITELNLDD